MFSTSLSVLYTLKVSISRLGTYLLVLLAWQYFIAIMRIDALFRLAFLLFWLPMYVIEMLSHKNNKLISPGSSGFGLASSCRKEGFTDIRQ